MTEREKLVELINHVCEHYIENLLQPGGAEALANHLIANGVTVQNWRDAKTDPPPINKEVLMCFGDEDMAVGWLADIEDDDEPVWSVCVEQHWYNTSPCGLKWQPLPKPPKEE